MEQLAGAIALKSRAIPYSIDCFEAKVVSIALGSFTHSLKQN